MDTRGLSRRKRVPVSRLRPGVYVVALDQSWFHTPFLFHRKLIKDEEEIENFKRYGIREVVIDIARGLDVDSAPRNEQIGEKTAAAGENKIHAAPSRPRSPIPEPSLRTVIREIETGRTVHEEALFIAQTILDGVGSGGTVSTPAARKVVNNLLSSVARCPEANLLLTQMRRFQNDLFSHSVNVCVLALVVGTFEGLEVEMTTLGLGALLHDVGQTRLPRNLVSKDGEFTDAERRIIEQHPGLGALMLKQSDSVPEAVRKIVLEHHERLNGSGYPCRLGRGEIGYLSQIVAITDAYDGMLTGRNQLAAAPIEVLRQLYFQGHAGAFDLELVERIIHYLGIYPVGSLVELGTGERGVVIAPNRQDALKPKVRIIASPDGEQDASGPVVDLAQIDPGGSVRRIVRALDANKEGVNIVNYLKLSAA